MEDAEYLKLKKSQELKDNINIYESSKKQLKKIVEKSLKTSEYSLNLVIHNSLDNSTYFHMPMFNIEDRKFYIKMIYDYYDIQIEKYKKLLEEL